MFLSNRTWMMSAGVGVIVLLLGLLMIVRRRQSMAEFEKSVLSGTASDSATETADSAETSASETSFLSDFGTTGMGTMQTDEVDPLAEAEVYLAYGRDEQAEEVLKEAARRNPERSEIKLKLLEIYKQRNDVKSFETIAEELYPAGDREDPEVWRQVNAMGRELNPDNPLFQEQESAETADVPGSPTGAATDSGSESAGSGATLDFDMDEPGSEPTQTATESGLKGSEMQGLDLDSETETPTSGSGGDSVLNLEESLPEQTPRKPDPATRSYPTPDEQVDLEPDIEQGTGRRAGTESTDVEGGPSREAAWEKEDLESATLDFPTGDDSEIEFDLTFDESSVQQLPESGDDSALESDLVGEDRERTREPGEGLLEFESDNIPPEETWAGPSTDVPHTSDEDALSSSPSDDIEPTDAPPYDEVETKLDLARAYLDMGDKVGARSIIDEVMREGDPAQRDRAAELASEL
ncbi:MAG: hypothetical protein MAG794_00070 [Gammaproteobacteria bacterium]|nr:hypothetical protein [Gammaproteobacteria bacterium]